MLSTDRDVPQGSFVRVFRVEGKYLEHPEAGYVIKDANMPLDAVNNTIRIFLGTQIGCAQCHNHPFDKWTQNEFYEIAAFMTGLQTKQGLNEATGKDHGKALLADLEKIKNPKQKVLRQFRESPGANLLVPHRQRRRANQEGSRVGW